MPLHTILQCGLILAGAAIMLLSILRSRSLAKALPFVPAAQRRPLARFLWLRHVLMAFFLCAYLAVLAAFLRHYSFVGETLVSCVFFLGAIFVWIGVLAETRLLAEVRGTLEGVLPICCKCKKIRSGDEAAQGAESWKEIEAYISEKTNMGFTHSYCPDCYAEELRKLARLKRPS